LRPEMRCSKCDGPLRTLGYRATVNEDKNQNYRPLRGYYHCLGCGGIFRAKMEVIKVGTL
jgi:uncharacterized protein with PIN domain